jgi:hypothetical protein
MNERKYYSPEEKVKIVLEGLSGTIQISELCRKYDIKPVRFHALKRSYCRIPHLYSMTVVGRTPHPKRGMRNFRLQLSDSRTQ